MSTCAVVRSFIESKTTEVQTANVGFTSEVSDYLVVHTGPGSMTHRLASQSGLFELTTTTHGGWLVGHSGLASFLRRNQGRGKQPGEGGGGGGGGGDMGTFFLITRRRADSITHCLAGRSGLIELV